MDNKEKIRLISIAGSVKEAAKAIGMSSAELSRQGKRYKEIGEALDKVRRKRRRNKVVEVKPIGIDYILSEKQRLYEETPYESDVRETIKEILGFTLAGKDVSEIEKIAKKVIDGSINAFVKLRAEKRASLESIEKFYKIFGDTVSKDIKKIQGMKNKELAEKAKQMYLEIVDVINKG